MAKRQKKTEEQIEQEAQEQAEVDEILASVETVEVVDESCVYTISYGVKLPSVNTQYQMNSVFVSVKGSDYPTVSNNAKQAFTNALVEFQGAWNEPLPAAYNDFAETVEVGDEDEDLDYGEETD